MSKQIFIVNKKNTVSEWVVHHFAFKINFFLQRKSLILHKHYVWQFYID